MMKYIVKVIATATEENANFKGKVNEYYYGNRGELIGVGGDEIYIPHKFDPNSKYDLNRGYDRLCDAKRCYSYKNPQNDEHWKSAVEILEFNI